MKYTLNVELVPLLEAKLGSMMRHISRNGLATYSYEKSEPYVKNHYLVVDIDIEAKYKIEGFSFVASLEFDKDQQCNLVKKISDDVVIPNKYRFRNECDHCKTNRNRVHTVLLRNNETEEYIQVGANCLKDFLGYDIGSYASYLSFYNDLEEYIEATAKKESYNFQPYFTFDEIVLQTLEYVHRFGYISKNESFENDVPATSSRVWKALNHAEWGGELLETEYEVTNKSKAELQDIKNELSQTSDDSDYVYDLKVLANSATVDGQNFGLACSTVGWYLRTVTAKKEREQVKHSEFMGAIGDKIQFTASPKCVFSSETEYGPYYIYRFIVDGNEVVWKTSKFLSDEESITLKGTVKSTDVFRGVKQTELTRCRVVC